MIYGAVVSKVKLSLDAAASFGITVWIILSVRLKFQEFLLQPYECPYLNG